MDSFLFIFGFVILPDVMRDNDENLMLRYQNGENEAFETLYRRHKDPLFRYLLRQCGNPATAEELFQDVWIKLVHARKSYSIKAKFKTYLFHIAHNRLIDHYRKEGRRVPISYDDCPEDMEIASPSEPTSNPENIASLEQQKEQFLSLVHALPETQKEAFLLKEETGLSIEEIAKITGVNMETAKSRLRYAVKKLRDAMRGVT
jgi:RNA polymerase sigma-70 factor (ECF subfamily)